VVKLISFISIKEYKSMANHCRMRIRIVGPKPDLERLAEQLEGLVEMVPVEDGEPFPYLDFKAWGVADENQYLALDEALTETPGHGWTEAGRAYRLDGWSKWRPPAKGLAALSAAYPTLVIALTLEVECDYTPDHVLIFAGELVDGFSGKCGRFDVQMHENVRCNIPDATTAECNQVFWAVMKAFNEGLDAVLVARGVDPQSYLDRRFLGDDPPHDQAPACSEADFLKELDDFRLPD
jgi:hypothetical protein